MRNSLKFLLEAEGWTVQLYSSADEFLEQDNQMIPGCLILDIRMPETSGLMLQSKLNDTECPLPIIFITAFAEVGTAVTKDWKRRSTFENTKKALIS